MPLARLHAILREMGGVAIAFSAGVDSSFLVRVAKDVLGERVVALMVRSRLLSSGEVEQAEAFCRAVGVRLRWVEFDPFEVPGFVENPKDRCYHCKKALLGAVVKAANEEGFSVVAEGSNLDDEGDYRPGRKAVKELGVRSPLQEAGLWKADIRRLSRELGLPTWDKPSFACLASRLTVGERITEERLRAVEAAEKALFARLPGLRQGRVRLHGAEARIEVEEADLERVLGARKGLLEDFRPLGFLYVSLDLAGYRTGSMNVGP